MLYLAGVIDTGGWYSCPRIDGNGTLIIPCEGEFREDLARLVMSLGLVACSTQRTGHNSSLAISGCGIDEIPTTMVGDIKPWLTNKVHNDRRNPLFCNFTVEPIEEKNYYGFTIDGNRRFLLGDFTVTHNTITAIKIATKLRLRTMIVCHRLVLLSQWEKSIKQFCPDAKVQIVTASDELSNADFYLMNVTNIPKKPAGFFSSVGTVIVDECHLIMAEGLSRSMLHLSPRYVLGLSATPYRTDGLNILLDLYFGKKKIIRKMHHKHTVWEVSSGFTPKVELTKNGKMNWGSVINSQAEDLERNAMIIRLVQLFPERTFLILTKRVGQARYLVAELKKVGETVTSLIGKEQTFDPECRILVGTSSKAGVGFDHPKLDALILAADIVQYFIQYLGRVFRRKDVEPIVFDILDKNPVLMKHYRDRKKVYIETGGIIRDFNREHPNFRVR